jgi:hypothetical protein
LCHPNATSHGVGDEVTSLKYFPDFRILPSQFQSFSTALKGLIEMDWAQNMPMPRTGKKKSGNPPSPPRLWRDKPGVWHPEAWVFGWFDHVRFIQSLLPPSPKLRRDKHVGC